MKIISFLSGLLLTQLIAFAQTTAAPGSYSVLKAISGGPM